MKREDVLARMFEAEFCEPEEKADKERELYETLERASELTGKSLHVLETAFLKVYPQYRARSLANELPGLPPKVRDK